MYTGCKLSELCNVTVRITPSFIHTLPLAYSIVVISNMVCNKYEHYK